MPKASFALYLPLPADFLYHEAVGMHEIYSSLVVGDYRLTCSARSPSGGAFSLNGYTEYFNIATNGLSSSYQFFSWDFTSHAAQWFGLYVNAADLDIINLRLARLDNLLEFTYAPLRPSGTLAMPQPLPDSAGGERIGWDYIAVEDVFDLPIRLTTAEVPVFLTFWRTVVRGMAIPFVYTDVRGVERSVTFNSPTLPRIVERAYNVHETTVSLRMVNE